MSNRAKILIVDDDKDLVVALRIALENQNFQVASAHDLQAGLAAAGPQPPGGIVVVNNIAKATQSVHVLLQRGPEEN